MHYLFLDIFKYQDNIKYLYNKINISSNICNPNEAYTEYVAIILYIYFIYKTNTVNMPIKSFMKKRLLIELGWSFYQISKILNYFKCYKSYEDLFTKNCEFNQDTNVLSYYILKTYFLFYSNKFYGLYILDNQKTRFNCIKEINLYDKKILKKLLIII